MSSPEMSPSKGAAVNATSGAVPNFQFALGPASPAVPLGQLSAALANAVKGGELTADFFFTLQPMNVFLAWVSANAASPSAWYYGTNRDGQSGYCVSCTVPPLQYQNVESPSTLVAMTLTAVVNPANDAPSGFQFNGQDYNIVGSLTGTITYNEVPVWHVELPLGLASAIGISVLMTYALPGIIAPVLGGFLNGVLSCFSGCSEAATSADVAVAAEAAAGSAEVDAVAVEGAVATVSLGVGAVALGGIALLIAIPFIVEAILHDSYHVVKVYNLTEYDITWSVPYINEGQMNMAPIAGQGSAGYNYLIPATGTLTIPGLQPTSVAHMADFNFVSGSETNGIQYVMAFELASNGAVQTVADVVFDIPFAGDNSLYACFDSYMDPQTLYSQVCGQDTTVAMNAPWNDVILSVTYDYLDGEHPTSSGGSAYYYQSLIVFAPANA